MWRKPIPSPVSEGIICFIWDFTTKGNIFLWKERFHCLFGYLADPFNFHCKEFRYNSISTLWYCGTNEEILCFNTVEPQIQHEPGGLVLWLVQPSNNQLTPPPRATSRCHHKPGLFFFFPDSVHTDVKWTCNSSSIFKCGTVESISTNVILLPLRSFVTVILP